MNRTGKDLANPSQNSLADLELYGYDFIKLPPNSKGPPVNGWRKSKSIDPCKAQANGFNVGTRLRPLDLVIDVDPRNFPEGCRPDKELALDQIIAPRVQTGGGGTHIYLQLPEGFESKIHGTLDEYPGIDFKHFGGYVLAPGSIHDKTGRPYLAEPMNWLEGPVPIVPERILSLIIKQATASGAKAQCETSDDAEELAAAVLQCDYNKLASNDAWLKLGMALHEVAGDHDLVRDAFMELSARDPNYSSHIGNNLGRWESFHRGESGNVGAGTLISILLAHDVTPPSFLKGSTAPEDFEDVPSGEMKQPAAGLCILDSAEFLTAKFPQREKLLDPIIRTQSLSMVHSWRGFGKTYFALSIACAVASGGKFLKWSAPRPASVVYIDGEMPGVDMQSRLSSIIKGVNAEIKPGRLRILTGDLQPSGVSIPLLSERAGQKRIEDQLKDTELLILDNLSCLMRGDENEAESWIAMQEWLLTLRRRNVSVILIHHSGKEGAQRGTSKREDVLDTVITLKRPSGYLASEGARFEIHFEKCRGVYGKAVEPFEVRLETELTGAAMWHMVNIGKIQAAKAEEMFAAGASIQAVMSEFQVSKATAYRLKGKNS